MKNYINPTTEVIHVEAMQALCEGSVQQPSNPNHAPERKEVF
jgi:hypothetical protein